MASPRITNSMRDGIIKNTIDHQFKVEREAMQKKEHALAARVYREKVTPAQEKSADALGDKWVSYSTTLSVGAGGGYRGNLHLPTKRPVADSHQYRENIITDPALADEVKVFFEERLKLEARIDNAALQLRAVLESVQTFKKLRVIWPQGEKFFDMYDVDSESKPGVPAVVIEDLNKVLGIK